MALQQQSTVTFYCAGVMCDSVGSLPVRGHGSDLMALVDKERAVFSERCQQYQQTGILPPIGDLHAVLTNKLALIRLVANEPNLRLAFDSVLLLSEIWQDERLWEGGVQVEVRHRALAPSRNRILYSQCPLRLPLMVLLALRRCLRPQRRARHCPHPGCPRLRCHLRRRL